MRGVETTPRRARPLAVAAMVGVALLFAQGGGAVAAPTGTTGSAGPAGGSAEGWRVPSVTGERQSSGAGALRYEREHETEALGPGLVPPGVNDVDCVPGDGHARPVVLVHGTDASTYRDFAYLGPRLIAEGYCVFGLDYGHGPQMDDGYAWVDLSASARQLAAFVDLVRAETGAAEVDVIAFSQGANVSRYWIKRLGGDAAVHRWVGLAAPTYGGSFYGVGTVLAALDLPAPLRPRRFSPALEQQVTGSRWLTELNADGDAAPGVYWTTIATRTDEMIGSVEAQLLRDPAARNLVVQDLCPADLGGHMYMAYDPLVISLVLGELDPSRPREHPCRPVPPGAGIVATASADNGLPAPPAGSAN